MNILHEKSGFVTKSIWKCSVEGHLYPNNIIWGSFSDDVITNVGQKTMDMVYSTITRSLICRSLLNCVEGLNNG